MTFKRSACLMALLQTLPTRKTGSLCILLLLAAAAYPGRLEAQTGYAAAFGGGSFYKTGSYNIPSNITEIEDSGFTEAVVWNIAVDTAGDLNFNYEFPLVTNGVYVGATTYPNFAADMTQLKKGSVKRVTFSLGSSNFGVFQNIESLVEAQGTGPTSILYKDFEALRAAIPALDAIDLDDENNYDTDSTVKFAEMLGKMGLKVIPDAYTNNSYWTNVVTEINAAVPGTVDAVHLQAYAGGDGNTPCSDWNFGTVPVLAGLGSTNSGAAPADSPGEVESQMSSWHSQCAITGGFMWIYDDFVGSAAQYASAINSGVDAVQSTVTGPYGGYNVNGVYSNGTVFTTGGLDGDGYAYSEQALGETSANTPNVWSKTTVKLPLGVYHTLVLSGTAVNGNQTAQKFTVNYTDGTTKVLTQSLSDWFTPQSYSGEKVSKSTTYRAKASGGKQTGTFNLYSYTFSINTHNKTVESLTLPDNRNVVVLGVTAN